MRQFGTLTEQEIECRISEIDRQGRFLRLLLYKTARTDAAILDKLYTPMGWQNEYKTIDGKLYCGISVQNPNTGGWITKWNVGTESNIEAQKGEASDAMKRAGFVWGIGTELYSAPEIRVMADKCNIKEYSGKYKCYDRFTVEKIAYNEAEEISGLAILCNGRRCFVWQRQ